MWALLSPQESKSTNCTGFTTVTFEELVYHRPHFPAGESGHNHSRDWLQWVPQVGVHVANVSKSSFWLRFPLENEVMLYFLENKITANLAKRVSKISLKSEGPKKDIFQANTSWESNSQEPEAKETQEEEKNDSSCRCGDSGREECRNGKQMEKCKNNDLLLSHFSRVRPHRRQPTRLPRPWDSLGKNTGVGAIALRVSNWHCLVNFITET